MSTSLRRLHVPIRKLWPPRAGARLFPAYHTFGSSRAEWGKDGQILRMHSDPEYRKKRYESRSVADKKRYHENHEYHELKKRTSRDYCRSHAQDPIYKIRNHISKWITKFAWVREELDWKSHIPIYSDTRVVRYCKSCEHAGIRGTKLWWSRKYDPTIYDCNRCFLGADPRKALPKHCEDVTTFKELRQRRDELRAMKFSTKDNSDKAANTTEPKSGGL